MRFFLEFCKETDIDPEKSASNPLPYAKKLKVENEALKSFKQ